MEDNKLNGFNNGRDTTDGVGGEEWSLNDKLKWEKENSPYVYKPSVKEAIEVLCNALREDENQINALQSTMRTTKKLEILKTIANSMKIDWDIVKENEQIISLNLKPIIK